MTSRGCFPHDTGKETETEQIASFFSRLSMKLFNYSLYANRNKYKTIKIIYDILCKILSKFTLTFYGLWILIVLLLFNSHIVWGRNSLTLLHSLHEISVHKV